MKARLREIDELLKGWDDLVEERSRLEAALAALGGGAGAKRADGANEKNGRKPYRKGVSNDIVKLVGERPGISAAEVGNVLDVTTPHQRLDRLAKSGKLEKFDLPSGGKGWRVPQADDATEPAEQKRTRDASSAPKGRKRKTESAPAGAYGTASEASETAGAGDTSS